MSEESNTETVCASCGFQSRAGANFCGNCGESLQAGRQYTCSACGSVNEPGDRFCGNCGNGLGGVSTAVHSVPQPVRGEARPLVRLSALSLRAKAFLILTGVIALAIAALVWVNGGQGEVPGGQQAASNPLPFISGDPYARVEPDPATLNIRGNPTAHHFVELVSNRSVEVAAAPGVSRLVVHNAPDLEGMDGCAGRQQDHNGNSSILLIKPPDTGKEWRAAFFIVGCTPGEGILEVSSEGAKLNTYTITVKEP